MAGVDAVTVLGTFPVTQQVVGAVFMGVGIVGLIANVAKRIFHGIQKYFETDLLRKVDINSRIWEDVDNLKGAAGLLALGALTFIPVLGSILWGSDWYDKAQIAKAVV